MSIWDQKPIVNKAGFNLEGVSPIQKEAPKMDSGEEMAEASQLTHRHHGYPDEHPIALRHSKDQMDNYHKEEDKLVDQYHELFLKAQQGMMNNDEKESLVKIIDKLRQIQATRLAEAQSVAGSMVENSLDTTGPRYEGETGPDGTPRGSISNTQSHDALEDWNSEDANELMRLARKYLNPGEEPPGDEQVEEGPRGGRYYETGGPQTASEEQNKKPSPPAEEGFEAAPPEGYKAIQFSGVNNEGTIAVLEGQTSDGRYVSVPMDHRMFQNLMESEASRQGVPSGGNVDMSGTWFFNGEHLVREEDYEGDEFEAGDDEDRTPINTRTGRPERAPEDQAESAWESSYESEPMEFDPDDEDSMREMASEWHGGGGSQMYQFASTGRFTDPAKMLQEINDAQGEIEEGDEDAHVFFEHLASQAQQQLQQPGADAENDKQHWDERQPLTGPDNTDYSNSEEAQNRSGTNWAKHARQNHEQGQPQQTSSLTGGKKDTEQKPLSEADRPKQSPDGRPEKTLEEFRRDAENDPNASYYKDDAPGGPEDSSKSGAEEGNGYIVIDGRGKRVEVRAKSSYEAQQKAAQMLGIKENKRHTLTPYLAEKDGQPYKHSTASLSMADDTQTEHLAGIIQSQNKGLKEDAPWKITDSTPAGKDFDKEAKPDKGGFKKIEGPLSYITEPDRVVDADKLFKGMPGQASSVVVTVKDNRWNQGPINKANGPENPCYRCGAPAQHSTQSGSMCEECYDNSKDTPNYESVKKSWEGARDGTFGTDPEIERRTLELMSFVSKADWERDFEKIRTPFKGKCGGCGSRRELVAFHDSMNGPKAYYCNNCAEDYHAERKRLRGMWGGKD